MTFLQPVMLVVGSAVALIVVLGRFSHARRLRRLGDFLGGPRGAGRLAGSDLYRLQTGRIALVAGAVLLFAASAAEPGRTGRSVADSSDTVGRSAVVVIDVSRSMQAADVSPTRLAAAVQAAEEILVEAAGARIGLVLFAGKGYVLAPPTPDIEALSYLLRGVAPTVVSPQDPGSLLSVGIGEAARLLLEEDASSDLGIVLISDGETGEPDAAASLAAQRMAETGISVHTVGVGTRVGAEPPALSGGRTRATSSALELAGASRLQPELLRRMSREGGGEYAEWDDRAGVRRIAREIGGGGGGGSSSTLTSAGIDPALLFGLVGLLLLLLDGFLEISRPHRDGRLGSRGTADG